MDVLKEEIAKLQAKELYVFSALFCCTFNKKILIMLDLIFMCNHDSVFYRQLLGQDLTGLSLKELQHLEQKLNEGLLCVKQKKVSPMFLLIYVFSCPSSIIRSKSSILNHYAVK